MDFRYNPGGSVKDDNKRDVPKWIPNNKFFFNIKANSFAPLNFSKDFHSFRSFPLSCVYIVTFTP